MFIALALVPHNNSAQSNEQALENATMRSLPPWREASISIPTVGELLNSIVRFDSFFNSFSVSEGEGHDVSIQ